jgi:hypothetical protein
VLVVERSKLGNQLVIAARFSSRFRHSLPLVERTHLLLDRLILWAFRGSGIAAPLDRPNRPCNLIEANAEPHRAARVAQPTDGGQILQVGADFPRMQMPVVGKLPASQLDQLPFLGTALQMAVERRNPQSTAWPAGAFAFLIELLQRLMRQFNGVRAYGVKAHWLVRSGYSWVGTGGYGGRLEVLSQPQWPGEWSMRFLPIPPVPYLQSWLGLFFFFSLRLFRDIDGDPVWTHPWGRSGYTPGINVAPRI